MTTLVIVFCHSPVLSKPLAITIELTSAAACAPSLSACDLLAGGTLFPYFSRSVM